MKEEKHVCRHCGARFKAEGEIPLCAYCREVILGEEDEEWMPEIRLEYLKKDLTRYRHLS